MEGRLKTMDQRPKTKDQGLSGGRADLGLRSLVLGHWSRRGFTLVEIMLVVIIIGVLAAMVVPRFAGRTEQAKVARAKSDIAAIGLALDIFELDMGVYPETIKDLAAKPGGDSENWKGPYIKQGKQLIDPWGHEYDYTRPTEQGKDYVLKSMGPDGKPGNDDLSNQEESH